MEANRQQADVINGNVQDNNQVFVNALNAISKQMHTLETGIRMDMNAGWQKIDEERQKTHQLLLQLQTNMEMQRQYNEQLYMWRLHAQRTLDSIPIPYPFPPSSPLNSQANNHQQEQQPHQLTQQQPQRPPPQLALQPTIETESRTKGYSMQHDNGRLTIRQAWDEYHGPMAEAKTLYSDWPYSPGRKRAYQRRQQLVRLITQKAEKENQTIESMLEFLTTNFMGRTINSVREELLASSKE